MIFSTNAFEPALPVKPEIARLQSPAQPTPARKAPARSHPTRSLARTVLGEFLGRSALPLWAVLCLLSTLLVGVWIALILAWFSWRLAGKYL